MTAPTAESESQGQARSKAGRVGPGDRYIVPTALRGPNTDISAFQALSSHVLHQGRLPMNRDCPWLSYSAPLALRPLTFGANPYDIGAALVRGYEGKGTNS